MKKRSKRISPEQLEAELEEDPAYQRMMRNREQEQRENVKRYLRAAEPVLRDLALAGFPVGSVRELRRAGTKYRAAVPILLRWLPKVSDLSVKVVIFRTLSVTWSIPHAAPVLVVEF